MAKKTEYSDIYQKTGYSPKHGLVNFIHGERKDTGEHERIKKAGWHKIPEMQNVHANQLRREQGLKEHDQPHWGKGHGNSNGDTK